MKKLVVSLGALAVVAFAGYQFRLELLLAILPTITSITDPMAPHHPIRWSRGPAVAAAAPRERPPNIVVILADDMGFNDVSFYNGGAADGSLQTPSIDSIARSSVAFSNG